MRPFPKKLWLLFCAASLVCAGAQGATLTVTTTTDGGAGSLRKAIADAASGDTINFQIPKTDGYNSSTGYWTILLTGATASNKAFLINKNLTIDASAQNIVIRRDPGAPADFRIFNVFGSAASLTLIHVWISNGNVTAAPGSFDAGYGGGIYNSNGTLRVRDCIFTGNAGTDGGAIASFSGITRVERTTFSGNSASDWGGGIYITSLQLNIVEGCTFNANRAGEGAAIFNYRGGIFIKSSTITGNNADLKGASSQGGGVAFFSAAGATHIENSIVVGNLSVANPDVSGPIVSNGHNLIGSPEGNSGFTASGDQVGVTAGQVNLAPLADNGGPNPTMRPRPGSIAIDKGKQTTDENGQLVNVDQRGFPRPADRPEGNAADGTDIGAVELGIPQTGPTFTVQTLAERNDVECTFTECTLFDALKVTNAVPDANVIEFAPQVRGTIFTDELTPFGLPINQPVTINGPGARLLTIDANFLGRVFNVIGSNVVISGVSIFNGRRNNDNGGGILNTGGLTLNDCMLFGNGTRMSSGSGGAIYNNSSATLVLNRCTLDGNSAVEFGGGVFNDGTFTAINCSFSSNTAFRGGAIISRFNGGASSSIVRNCTITFNTATSSAGGSGDGGGGYYAEGGTQQHHVGNTIIANNSNTINPDVRGNYTSDGHNFIGNVANAVGFSNNVNGDQVGTPGNVKDPKLGGAGDFGGPVDTRPLLPGSPAINAGDDSLAPPTDQRGYGRNGPSDIGAFEFGGIAPAPPPTPTPTATPTAPPTTLANISTRLRVETSDNVLIGGFIVTGTQSKKVIIRGIGPSLPFAGHLDNPMLELRDGTGALLDSNDDWVNSPNKQAIIDSTIPPSTDFESAIVATLPANGAGYTAIVRGVNDGTGIGVVEAYDLDRSVDSKLANISTRGLVQTGDNVLIAGMIVLGSETQKVIVRAIGPSLPIAGRLENPALELRDQNGGVIEANDNWVDSPNKQAIIDSTIPPGNDLESAIVRILSPAAYTAIVRGAADTTGIAVVEVYALTN